MEGRGVGRPSSEVGVGMRVTGEGWGGDGLSGIAAGPVSRETGGGPHVVPSPAPLLPLTYGCCRRPLRTGSLRAGRLPTHAHGAHPGRKPRADALTAALWSHLRVVLPKGQPVSGRASLLSGAHSILN